MLELPHVLVGTAIAVSIHNPVLSLPLAFASHFVLDLIPHWDPPLKRYRKQKKQVTSIFLFLFVDSFTALTVGTYVALLAYPDFLQFLNIMLCAFLAVLPDVLGIPEIISNKPFKFARKLLNFQDKTHNNTSLIPGILTQLIAITLSLFIIF